MGTDPNGLEQAWRDPNKDSLRERATTMNDNDPRKDINCTACPLHKTRTSIVWGTPQPPRPCKVLLIGEAPGEEEDYQGKPFTGGAGSILWKAIFNSNLSKYKNTLAITNIIRCRPPHNRDPNDEEISACKYNLDLELQLYKPQLVITLGEVPLNAVTGLRKIGTWHNSFEWRNGVLYLYAYHPAYMMRSPHYLLALINAFNTAAELLENPTWERRKVNYVYDPSPPHLSELLLMHCEIPPKGLTFDLETTGLDPYKDTLIGFSFSGIGNAAVAVNLNREDPYNDPHWLVFEKYLQDGDIPKTIQNATFDIYWLLVQGHPVYGLNWDTKLAAGMLYSDLPRNLSWLRAWYTDVLPYKEQVRKIGVWNLPKDRLAHYACQDADVTERVKHKQLIDMAGTRLIECYDNVTRPLTEALISIMHRGVLVDQVALIEMMIEHTPTQQSLFNKYLKLGIELSSPKQIGEYLTSKGFILPYTEKGNLSTAKDVFENLEDQIGSPEQRTILNEILEYRHHAKIVQTYLVGLRDLIKPDGRVHTLFDSTGTSTGRLSSSEPNLQNQPKEVRSIFIPDPGYYLIDTDYTMLELLVAAIRAREDKILDIIRAGGNIHKQTAEMLFKLPIDKITQDQYELAKRVTFGTIYGLAPRTLAGMLKVPTDVAQGWQEKIMYQYPKLIEWRDRNIKEWRADGYLETPFGRIRHCASITEAYNYPVSSPAADVCNISLMLLEQQSSKTGIQPLIAVHDEVLLQAPNAMPTLEAEAHIRSVMCRPIPELNNWEFDVKIKTGPNWKACKTFKGGQ